LIITSVKNNNIQQFRELMEQYDTFEVDSKSNSGWNPLHYACYFGHLDIVYDLIMKHQANVNIPNVDGWTPLHLTSFKGHQEIVKLLLSLPDTDINCNVPGIGTPLHCACKKNNLQVVSILLFKADYK
jgi:ankyrin repeat protein